MRFLRKSKKAKKHILIISDLHLSAGALIDGKRNLLEDFHSDQELEGFIHYFSNGEYANRDVELIINGDFLDLLAVPYIKYFDDEYWSEKAALEKLNMILDAHPEVMSALNDFVKQKNKKIVYIIGNHDSELVFDSLKERFLELFDKENREKVIIDNKLSTYEPAPGIFIQHGHEYEHAHQFDPLNTTITSANGDKYFIPSWGSYYVTHVINKYKQERGHVNEAKPIRNFLIHGMIFDTFFTIRFMIANAYYYFMVRFLHYFRRKTGWKNIVEDILSELTLWEDYEALTREFFQRRKDARVLIVGHTHKPTFREYSDGTKFINTGTWMRTVNLDLKNEFSDVPRTFAHIQIFKEDYNDENFNDHVMVDLHRWAPKTTLPYEDYN
jgi:UDP-2,3-diacylglucosamine pyrophosphatase LpxH